MPISESLKFIYASAPVTDTYVETLELRHSQFADGSIYITNQLAGWTGKLENGSAIYFQFLPFAVVPPQSADEGNFTLQVAIDNASKTLMEQLELLAERPTESIELYYRIYLASDVNTVQNDPPLKLSIESVTATQSVVAFSAGLANLRKLPFPSMVYDTALYPGLSR